jgi:hypothetical protein
LGGEKKLVVNLVRGKCIWEDKLILSITLQVYPSTRNQIWFVIE